MEVSIVSHAEGNYASLVAKTVSFLPSEWACVLRKWRISFVQPSSWILLSLLSLDVIIIHQ